MRLGIYDAIAWVSKRTGKGKQEAWKEIKDHISLEKADYNLPAWVVLSEYPEPFLPTWIARLAKFQAAPTDHGTTPRPAALSGHRASVGFAQCHARPA